MPAKGCVEGMELAEIGRKWPAEIQDRTIAAVALLRRDALLPRSLSPSIGIINRDFLLAQRDESIEMVVKVVEGGQQDCWPVLAACQTELYGTITVMRMLR
jgi:hypothetical protein